MCPAQTIKLTPEQFKAAAAKILVQYGIEIDTTKPSGEIDAHGAFATWAYDGENLTYSILSKPWIISCGHANQAVAEFFQ